MARKSFMDQKIDFTKELINNTEDIIITENLTDEIVKEHKNKIEEIINNENEIKFCSPDKFIPYSNEKLRLELHYGEKREQLKESISRNGIINPIICIPNGDKFEIVSGHNRVDICKELGIEVPYILKPNLSREESDLICIDTNILNRQHNEYKPSQFAYILKVKFDAEKHQGTLLPGVTNTGTKIGEEYGLSRKTIHMYIKLNDLIDTGKLLVDDGIITIKAAYELASMTEELQNIIINMRNDYKLTDKSLKEIRTYFSSNENLDYNSKVSIIKSFLKAKNIKTRQIDYRNIKKYIPDIVEDENVEDYIISSIKKSQISDELIDKYKDLYESIKDIPELKDKVKDISGLINKINI